MPIDTAIDDEPRGHDCRISAGLCQYLGVQRDLERSWHLETFHVPSLISSSFDTAKKAQAGLIDDIPMPARLDERDASRFCCNSRSWCVFPSRSTGPKSSPSPQLIFHTQRLFSTHMPWRLVTCRLSTGSPFTKRGRKRIWRRPSLSRH